MSGPNTPVTRVKGTSTLVRPRFEPGMLLQHDDLELMSSYPRELNRLMFRSLFGCGVVCGLVVEAQPPNNCRDCIVVHGGLAIDGCGDPIYMPKDEPLCIDESCIPSTANELWVVLCRTSRYCSPRAAMCPSDQSDTSTVCTRERDGYEIRVVSEAPSCACQCEAVKDSYKFDTPCLCADPERDCYKDHYAGRCECTCGDCAGGCCDCVCVVLAHLQRPDGPTLAWTVDHSVRRFVRPVLIRDPQIELDKPRRAKTKVAKGGAAKAARHPGPGL